PSGAHAIGRQSDRRRCEAREAESLPPDRAGHQYGQVRPGVQERLRRSTIDGRFFEVRCMEYVCELCRETFPVEVWHCPLCRHHWPVEEEECGNCHTIYAPDTHS